MNISSIRFYNVKFPRDLSHVSRRGELPYANLELTGYKYIHLNAPIDVNASIDDLANSNYISFVNPEYDNGRIMYAFIDDLTFISKQTTRVAFSVDPWMTYRNNIYFNDTFIEREHVKSDNLGEHTVPENFELGDYITNDKPHDLYDGNCVAGVFVNAYKDGEDWKNVTVSYYDGLPCAYKIYWFDVPLNTTGPAHGPLYLFFEDYIKAGKADNILGILLLNEKFLNMKRNTSDGSAGVYGEVYGGDNSKALIRPYMAKRENAFEGYKPKNNKLYNFPFRTLKLHNNSSNAVFLKPENQKNFDSYSFTLNSAMHNMAPVVKCSITAEKQHYDYDNFMMLSNFPQLSWNSNTYAAYLANNSGNIIAQATGAIAGFALAPTTGGASLGLTAGSVSSIANTVGAFYDRSKQGSKAEGTLTASTVNVNYGRMTFTVQEMSISKEYAKIIDEFFTMFGYKVNRVKKPEIYTRRSFNYVKTNGMKVTGNIPQKFKDELNSAFDRGMTFWESYANMFNYDVNNSIV